MGKNAIHPSAAAARSISKATMKVFMPKQGLPRHYSADVDLWMDCGAHGKVALSHAADDFVIAARAKRVPACNVQIVLVVDGHKYERPARLPLGMSADNREAVLSDIPPF